MTLTTEQAAAQVGLVYYADDPTQSAFRVVFPQEGDPDDVLDDPQWLTFGVDPDRAAVMSAISAEDYRGLVATPDTSPDDALMNFAYSCPAVQAALAAGATNLADIQSAALSAAQDAIGAVASLNMGHATNNAQASLAPPTTPAPADILAAAQDAASAIDLVLPDGN